MKTSFWLALMFLTRLPVPNVKAPSAADHGRSLAYFPLVGLIIGLLLAAVVFLTPSTEPLLAAALALLVWVFITGGLHIDGLADSADAWLGGLGDKARTLEIMKDPRAGSAAVMAVVCVLLVKFAALASLPRFECLLALMLVPMLGRCVPALLFLTSPYAREKGLASAMVQRAEPRVCFAIIGLVLVLISMALFYLLSWFVLLFWFLLGLQLWALRALMLARIDGVTGDTVGASVEITEMSALVLIILLMQ